MISCHQEFQKISKQFKPEENLTSVVMKKDETEIDLSNSNSIPIPQSYYEVSVSDSFIASNLLQSRFSHPFTIVGILNQDWSIPSFEDINLQIKPFMLSISNKDHNLYKQILSLYHITSNEIIDHYKKDIKIEDVLKDWRALFSYSGLSPEEIDLQANCYNHPTDFQLPDLTWKLSTMDDLFHLHFLACILNTKIFLILPRSLSSKSNSYLPSSIYTSVVGSNSPKYHMYIICQSSESFFIAQPFNYKKVSSITQSIPITKDSDDLPLFIKSAEIHPSLTSDSILLKKQDLSLHLIASLSPHHYLRNILPKFIPNITISEKPYQSNIEPIAFFGGKFAVTMNEKEKMDSLHIKKPSQIYHLLSQLNRNAIYSSGPEDLNDNDAYRLMSPFLTKSDQQQLSTPSETLPIFLPQKNTISLSSISNSAYAEFLSLRSLFQYSISSSRRICTYCQNVVEPGSLMRPYHHGKDKNDNDTTAYEKICGIGWICDNCFNDHSLSSLELIKTNIEIYFPFFSNVTKESIISNLEIINENIIWTHIHPIGFLNKILPQIDSAFLTLQIILSTYEKWSIKTKKTMSIGTLLSIKDQNEAKAQFGFLSSSAANVPIQPKLFSEFLSHQKNISLSEQQFCLVQSSNVILETLDELRALKAASYFGSATGPNFSISISSDHLFDFKLAENTELKPRKARKYQLREIVNSCIDNTIAIEISTSQKLYQVYETGRNEIIAITMLDHNSDNPYYTTSIYRTSKKANLDSLSPIYQTDKPIHISNMDYNYVTGELAIAYSTLEFFGILYGKPENLVSEAVEAKGVVFGPDGMLYYLRSDNALISLSDCTEISFIENAVAILKIPQTIIAITEGGVLVNAFTGEELSNCGCDGKFAENFVYTRSEDGSKGLLGLGGRFIALSNANPRMNNNQNEEDVMTIFNEVTDSNTLSLLQSVPVNISVESMFNCLPEDLLSMESSVKSYYSRVFASVSLGHIEWVIRQSKEKKVYVIAHVGELNECDRIFGTHFVRVGNGIHFGMRLVKNSIVILIGFSNKKCKNSEEFNDELQREFETVKRGGNLTACCVTLKSLHIAQKMIPENEIVFCFNSSERNIDGLENVKCVMIEKGGNYEAEFWNRIIFERDSFEPQCALNMLKAMAALYLTLEKYNDLPKETVISLTSQK